jgi:D-aminoacyl-tRNA deacylase
LLIQGLARFNSPSFPSFIVGWFGMILIVASTEDLASTNIAKKLLKHYEFERFSEDFQRNPVYFGKFEEREVKLVYVNDDTINTQYITDFFNPQLIVFLSRHSSASGTPTLSVHTPGNLTNEARFGGVRKKISISPAGAMKEALIEMTKLKRDMELDYKVSYECTHHGPSLDVPTMFAELGSSSKQWRDVRAAEVVAHAAMAAVSKQSQYRTVLGIGGPHYNEKFTNIALTTNAAFGHIIPKYAIPQMDAEVIRRCVERTVETVESAFLEWKGIRGADKGKLIAALEKIGVPIEKV